MSPSSGVLSEASTIAGPRGVLSRGGIAVEPSGKFLYVSDEALSEVNVYSIKKSTGELTAINGSPFFFQGGASGIAVDSIGSFLFLARSEPYVSVFAIDKNTGELTEIAGSPFGTIYTPGPGGGGLGLQLLALDPSDKYLYASGCDGIQAFSVDSTTRALTEIMQLRGYCNYDNIIIEPSGSYLYWSSVYPAVPRFGQPAYAAVGVYAIDRSTGTLSGNFGLQVPNDGSLFWPAGLAFSGNFLYVKGSGGIYAFSIDHVTNTSTPVAGSPFPCDDSAFLAVDPTGKYLYDAYGDAYKIDQVTGALTPVPGSPFPAYGNDLTIVTVK
jgi:6-phosphogluconolactonase (cycloisomerase 2 family)